MQCMYDHLLQAAHVPVQVLAVVRQVHQWVQYQLQGATREGVMGLEGAEIELAP